MENKTSQTPATQTPQQANIAKMRAVLDNVSIKKQFENALGKESAPFIASVMEIYSSDSNLTVCDPNLVIREALKAAVLKLPVIRSLGQAYIIPYKKKGIPTPTFIIGYKGLVQLAIRSNQYRTINADVVYDGELQKVDKISGEIAFEGKKKSDKVIGYFAYIELKGGFTKTLYMTKENIDAHAKKYSKVWGHKDGLWETNYDEMALKTVLRNLLSKWGLLSVEMISYLEQGDDIALNDIKDEEPDHNGKKVITTDVTFEEVNTKETAPIEEEGPGY